MSIRYDESRVIRPFLEREYDESEIKSLVECSKDVNEFIKHVKIVHPDRGVIKYEPYDYQQELLDLISQNRYVVSLQARQSGKCVCNTTTIQIRNKHTGKVEDITIEDFLEKHKKVADII